jgi:hypothetical protein
VAQVAAAHAVRRGGLGGCLFACLLALTAGCGSSSSPAPAPTPPAYRVEALPAGAWTALNDTGDAVGQADQSGRKFAAFVRGGQVTDLGYSTDSRAVDVNGQGQALVNADNHVYLWISGSSTDLGRFIQDPNAHRAGVAITEDGRVLGSDSFRVLISNPPLPDTTADFTRGWVWKNGSFTGVGPNSGLDDFKPIALNGASQFIGTIRFDMTSSPLQNIYNMQGVIGGGSDLLPVPLVGNRLYDYVTDIAEDGRVVGYHSNGTTYDEKPEYWDADHQSNPRAMPTPAGLMGGKPARTRGGRVVGMAYTPLIGTGKPIPPGYTAGQPRAVLWEGKSAFDLNAAIPQDSGWVLQYADDVNAAGQILGRGTYNGQPASFLLTRLTNP